MKSTAKLRFVRRAVPDKTFGENISVYKHILQQWWESSSMGEVNIGFGNFPVGEVKGEWRDVPIEDEQA
jgi:hypothetical protein